MDILARLKNTADGCFFASNFGGSFLIFNFGENTVTIKKMFCSNEKHDDIVCTYITNIEGELRLLKDDTYGVVYTIKKENGKYIIHDAINTNYPVSCVLVAVKVV